MTFAGQARTGRATPTEALVPGAGPVQEAVETKRYYERYVTRAHARRIRGIDIGPDFALPREATSACPLGAVVTEVYKA